MTYKDVINYFKATNTEVNTTGIFVHGRKPDASFISIAAAWPMVFVLPFRETTDYKKEIIKRNIVMFFFLQDNINNTLDQREDLIESAFELKEEFIRKMVELTESPSNAYFGKFTFSEILATPEYAQLAGTVSGYSISFTLTSKTKCTN